MSLPDSEQATDGTSNMVRADEIRWTLEPIDQRREDDNPIDLYALAQDDQLLEYSFGAQDDLRTLRELLSESLAMNASQTDTIKRLTRVIAQQREQLRARR